jgi:hypothetical protein
VAKIMVAMLGLFLPLKCILQFCMLCIVCQSAIFDSIVPLMQFIDGLSCTEVIRNAVIVL